MVKLLFIFSEQKLTWLYSSIFFFIFFNLPPVITDIMVTQVCSQSDTAGLFLSHQGQCTTKPSLSLRYFKNNFSLKDKMSVFHVQLLGAFHYDKLTGQRSKGILEENGTSQPIVMVLIIKFILHTLFTHFTHFIFFFL